MSDNNNVFGLFFAILVDLCQLQVESKILDQHLS